MNDLDAVMKSIELNDEIAHLRRQLTIYHNGMMDISIMIEEGDYDEALAKANSYIKNEEG